MTALLLALTTATSCLGPTEVCTALSCDVSEEDYSLTIPSALGTVVEDTFYFNLLGFAVGRDGSTGFTAPDLSDPYTISGGLSEGFNAVTVDSSGKILAAGWARLRSGSRVILLARYSRYGGLDSSFGGGKGYVLGSNSGFVGGTYHVVNSVAIDDESRIVIGGYGYEGVGSTGSRRGFIARYLSDGSIDTDFNNGFVVSPVDSFLGGVTTGSVDDQIYGVAVSGSSIYAVGYAGTMAGTQYTLAVYYDEDGNLEESWLGKNTSGSLFDSGATTELFRALALDSDGNIVAVGSSENGGTSSTLVARFTEELGALDTSFNTTGYRVSLAEGVSDAYTSLQLDENDNLFAAGSSVDGSWNILSLMSFISQDGSSVSHQTGASGGGAYYDPGMLLSNDGFSGLLSLSDGSGGTRHFAVGVATDAGASSYSLLASALGSSATVPVLSMDTSGFNASGTPSFLFGGDETLSGSGGEAFQGESYNAIVATPDGDKLIVVGTATHSSKQYAILLMYGMDGSFADLTDY